MGIVEERDILLRTRKGPKSTCRQCGVVGHIAGVCWTLRHGANGNRGQERRLVNQGDYVGVQGASNCVETNG